MNKSYLGLIVLMFTCVLNINAQVDTSERFRPMYHFTPQEKWMNDPNGMVYNDGIYHLFYQHNPNSSKWGPMHWGHAISKDLVEWEHRPIALYPDSLGTIFSGSAVIDKNNTAGFGKGALVALFTSNYETRENGKRKRLQTQSLAYSLDNGVSWTKYEGNPVLPNPGIKAFRDPKVIWHEQTAKWVMSLTAGKKITFYGSADLKEWEKLSDFGEGFGSHVGVWECPDLFKMNYEGKEVWALIVSVNPGGPNGGSGTQYFLGEFDGTIFKAYDRDTRWLDWGTDNYAGVTWSNVADQHLFIGWMSNWAYANAVPTEKWRSTMTTVRDLKIVEQRENLFLTSSPIENYDKNFNSLVDRVLQNNSIDLSGLNNAFKISFKELDLTKDFQIQFGNKINEKLTLQYYHDDGYFTLDRSETGLIDFNKDFAKRIVAKSNIISSKGDLDIYIDKTSIEVFVNGGSIAVTALFFNENDFEFAKATVSFDRKNTKLFQYVK